ncbi:hypothetical protein pb186bvf_004431 [Paramecium bursaria]
MMNYDKIYFIFKDQSHMDFFQYSRIKWNICQKNI